MKSLSKYVISTAMSDGMLLFNTKNNHSIKVTNKLIDKLNTDDGAKKDYENYLATKGFYSKDNEFNSMMKNIFSKENETLRIIVLTHGDCNFRCLYCYEKFKNIAMSKETMDNILKFTEQKLRIGGYKNLRISWFGGEPLLGFKTIVYLSKKFQELALKYIVNYSADMTTNGFLLDAKKLDFLVNESKCRLFQITVDGNKVSHDEQRILKNGKGSYERIYRNLLVAQSSNHKFSIILRFNVSKNNYKNVEQFIDKEGVPFRKDKRFYFLYRNVGDWGQGEREKGQEVERLDKDISYQFSKKALTMGYQLIDPFWNINNQFSCYAQNPNSYAFNVVGKVMACTVLLYDQQNIFGDINLGLINEEKRKKIWIHSVEKIPKDCQKCEIVAICKSGACPKLAFADGKTKDYICKKNKDRFYQNLKLFIQQKRWEVTLDA